MASGHEVKTSGQDVFHYLPESRKVTSVHRLHTRGVPWYASPFAEGEGRATRKSGKGSLPRRQEKREGGKQDFQSDSIREARER